MSEDGTQTEYLVKYVGYPSDEDEWLDAKDLIYCQDKIADYEQILKESKGLGSRRAKKQDRKTIAKKVKVEVKTEESTERSEISTRQGSFE